MERIAAGLNILRQARPAGDGDVLAYLRGRIPNLPAEALERLRFHPECPFRKDKHTVVRLPAMVALMRDAQTGEMLGCHRTALQAAGCGMARDKTWPRRMLGRAAGAVVRLSADDEVTLGLGICEGIETGLSVMAAGWRPVWAALSAGGIARFPLLPGVEALTIFSDADDAGRRGAAACAERWAAAGREARIAEPAAGDWNDVIRCPE